jgi:hypothetical protein
VYTAHDYNLNGYILKVMAELSTMSAQQKIQLGNTGFIQNNFQIFFQINKSSQDRIVDADTCYHKNFRDVKNYEHFVAIIQEYVMSKGYLAYLNSEICIGSLMRRKQQVCI